MIWVNISAFAPNIIICGHFEGHWVADSGSAFTEGISFPNNLCLEGRTSWRFVVAFGGFRRRTLNIKPIHEDSEHMPSVVIVGSGIAGLFASLRCAQAGWEVRIVTKSDPRESSTNWAQGGIAGILDKTDGIGLQAHIKDTLSAGAGHCDEEIVRTVVEEAGDRILDLLSYGVKFDKNDSGEFDLAKEGGHSQKRILHTKDATGAEIERSLLDAVLSNPLISLRPNQLVVDLILRDYKAAERDIVGVWCLDLDNETMNTLGADAIILATGGAGQLYQHTTNPTVATADGTAMAIRAGAQTKDMAFIQFHPTALAIPGDRPFLITEALRGHGAVLLSKSEYCEWKTNGGEVGELSFTDKYSPQGSLATRDIVARAIDHELKQSGDDCVYLVTEHLQESELQVRFPTIANRLQRHHLRLGRDPLPVAPAAHYFVGGLQVDVNGRVKQEGASRTMAGLYAIGEVACSGMHGANRLASNSLLEAVVFAYRATDWIIRNTPDRQPIVGEEALPAWRCEDLTELIEHSPLKHDLAALQATMTHDVGLVKSNARLQRAARRLALLSEEADRIWRKCRPTRSLVELRNMILVAQHVCWSSQLMEQNIGLHFNQDLD